MNWKLKARIQRWIAMLPTGLSYEAYYWIQRAMGSLNNMNPIFHIDAGVGIVNHILAQNNSIEDKTFLEVGTGRHFNIPIVLWLCGAGKVITVDLNPYLKPELVRTNVDYIRTHPEEIIQHFNTHAKSPIFQERFQKLLNVPADNMNQLMGLMNIQYLSPADATALKLPSESVDYHVSFTVFEHIPVNILVNILIEGKRIMRKNGLFAHYVDFSDHFSHTDNSISPINFLQYTETEWHKLAGNRYMYHNRLRLDEFSALVDQARLDVKAIEPTVDPQSTEALKSGAVKPADRFRKKPIEVNATTGAWLIAGRPLGN